MTPPTVMKAVVIDAPGDADVLKLCERPIPGPAEGEVLIRVKAFGLNRAELMTRQGASGSAVTWPRVIGIECVGEVVNNQGGDLRPGQKVAALMGGMGRSFDGSYAEYTRVPRASVFPVTTDLPWAELAALPEMFQTANGSLRTGLRIEPGQSLLIRGGTSSVGLTAAALAKRHGLTVLSTTRSEPKAEALRAVGVDHVIIDHDLPLEDRVRDILPTGVDRVLDLVGTTTLWDSLYCAAPGGIVCMTGVLGGKWVWEDFDPFADIPNGVCLTSYGGGSDDITVEQLQSHIDDVTAGRLPSNLDRTFHLDEIRQAHRYMEANKAKGKLVVVTDDMT